jgi:hypothetical protein
MRASTKQGEHARQEVAELREKLAKVETRSGAEQLVLARLRDVAVSSQVGAAAQAEPDELVEADMPSAEEPREAVSEEERLRRAEEKMRQDLDRFAALLASQPRDTAWARDANTKIADRYASDAIAGLRVSSECASTICRVEYSYTQAADKEAVWELFSEPPWPGKRFCFLDAPQQAGTCFFAREGHRLRSGARKLE